jgi:hypothetical protein
MVHWVAEARIGIWGVEIFRDVSGPMFDSAADGRSGNAALE